MTIQWFPGHMTRARREIEQRLKMIDVVYELLDARIPLSSRNPMLDEIIKQKPRLVLLNKADLADPAVTEKWIHYFKTELRLETLPIDATASADVKPIVGKSIELLAHKQLAERRKGIRPRAIRALIIGIPNVGKSTLINRLAGRLATRTGDRPGMTKGQQWIKVANELELLDTPGVLWPKFDDPQVGMNLALTGAIREEVLDLEEIAHYTLRFLIEHYAERLIDRFQFDALPAADGDPLEIAELLEEIGRMRGCLMSGGRIDLHKASGVLLREVRSGKMGRISFEFPPMEN